MSTGGESAEGEKESEKNQEGERRRVREKDRTKERAKEIWEIPKKSFQHPDRRGGAIRRVKALLTQDVLVSHEHRLVDLSLPEPAGLLGGEEHLDRHLLPAPPAHPHLPVPPLADLLHHLDLLGDGPLYLRTQRRGQNGGLLAHGGGVKAW